ncbi:3-deoxy-D-manno-octulosonate 8-phosphate phosphatase [Polaribacter vadi]|uniref:3-deoxy-D-manno-octulosonate 8-phosphate phosphatase n=1 Tax=Polaribacter vadi TaxID=1774273 RepID=A0A1B8U209_9FLAO|nr:HAD-IIIA family hydrolase [Polaribacter vadi]AOW16440.1 3-deoxy-D-manno-octulosonate 8-phosphate phosphatase [Polaribacter vadi]OBY65861.1 3-deoxy-D-manno-octulosonate 8-phosphate phosphatase [Polaribacter vadi]
MEISYKQLLPKINTFIFDVDGVLTNGMLTIMPDGELVRHMNVKDGYAMKIALNKGFKVCIISGGTNKAVKSRLAALGILDIYLGAHDKIKQYNELVEKYNLKPENVLYMGDDIPDIPVMQKVGLASCPNDAVPEVQQISKYISYKKGGEGCVRDIIEQVMRVQGKWDNYFEATL